MKRTGLLLIAILFIGLYVVSNNVKFMKFWVNHRYSSEAIIESEKYSYGDLYALCNLKKYRLPAFHSNDLKKYYYSGKERAECNLYTICDSYLEFYVKDKAVFRNVNKYIYSRYDQTSKQVFLDKSLPNVLLIEVVERNAREAFADTAYIFKHLKVVDSKEEEKSTDYNITSWENNLFNKKIEQNLEFNLFDYPIFRQVKELKAELNYSFFDKHSPNVYISKTYNQLYLTSTIDENDIHSSFNVVNDEEIDKIVNNLNAVRNYYLHQGFDEVFLCIIPNPVSILEPTMHSYNKLIERIQNHEDLNIPFIDINSKFLTLKRSSLFQINDTHWNINGFLVWRNMMDSTLTKYRQKKDSNQLLTPL